MGEYTKDNLAEFLDFVGGKGMLKKSTASSYKVACNKVLSVLSEEEAGDVSNLDLDSIFRRYENLSGMTVTPNTMREYRRRVTDSIKEFLAFREDPSAWKPSTQQRVIRGPAPTAPKSRRRGEALGRNNGTGQLSQDEKAIDSDAAKMITHRFPLRVDTVVSITGIPFDVKRTEMGRLNAWLSNLVAQSDAQEVEPQMLPAPPESA